MQSQLQLLAVFQDVLGESFNTEDMSKFIIRSQLFHEYTQCKQENEQKNSNIFRLPVAKLDAVKKETVLDLVICRSFPNNSKSIQTCSDFQLQK